MATSLRRRLSATGHVLALGAVSWVFSEGFFWARWREGSSIPDLALTWLVYSVIAYLALAAARCFEVSSLAGLFLVGALYGWLAEGAIAGEAFVAFPFQLSWTGLAWHAPLTVCLGWYVLPDLLRHAAVRRALLVVGGLGLGVGLWTAGIVHDPDTAGIPSVPAVAAYGTAMAVVLALAYPACDRLAAQALGRPSRGALVAAGLGTLAWFLLAVAVAMPWAVIVLPVLLGLPLWALRAGGGAAGGRRPLLGPPSPTLGARAVLPLGLLPVVATATYAAAEPVVGLAPVAIVYTLTLPAGIAALAWSVRRVRRVGP